MEKISRNKLRIHRKRRIRAKISGTRERPRITVFKSLTQMYAQAIDDARGVTLLSVNTKKAKFKNDLQGAKELGKILANKCLEKNIKEVVFDRAGYPYQGKVKALAEEARAGGLKF